MKRRIIALCICIIFIIIQSIDIIPLDSARDLSNYYVENCYFDTGSINIVSGIYLNYRLFDTLFETLLLLVSVIGIIYFSRHEGDY